MNGGDFGIRILLCRAGSLVCGLPIERVAETMRPLPVEQMTGMPEFVSGLSIIRGKAVPVVDLAALLRGDRETRPQRLVVLKIEERRVALSVSQVEGIRTLERDTLEILPPLLGGARADLVSSIGSLDEQLLLVLASAHILPASVWPPLESVGTER
jgi:purine-binding chemotaxis protein CheW